MNERNSDHNPPTGFDPDCKDCEDGAELTLKPASPSAEEILASDDPLEASDWTVEVVQASDVLLDREPGRMGRLEDDKYQILKLWAGVLQCGLGEGGQVPLTVLLPQMADEGYLFHKDVDLVETLNRWDNRLLTADNVLNLGELRLWFED